MKKIYIITITLMVFAGMLTAIEKGMGKCQEGSPGMMQGRFEPEHQGGMMLMQMAEELELSEAQIAEMKDIQTENKKFMIRKKAEIEILQLDKRTAMQDKDFAEAKKLTAEIFEIKEEMALKKITLQEQQWNILTDQQKLKAAEMRPEKMCPPHEGKEGHGMRKGL